MISSNRCAVSQTRFDERVARCKITYFLWNQGPVYETGEESNLRTSWGGGYEWLQFVRTKFMKEQNSKNPFENRKQFRRNFRRFFLDDAVKRRKFLNFIGKKWKKEGNILMCKKISVGCNRPQIKPGRLICGSWWEGVFYSFKNFEFKCTTLKISDGDGKKEKRCATILQKKLRFLHPNFLMWIFNHSKIPEKVTIWG